MHEEEEYGRLGNKKRFKMHRELSKKRQ